MEFLFFAFSLFFLAVRGKLLLSVGYREQLFVCLSSFFVASTKSLLGI